MRDCLRLVAPFFGFDSPDGCWLVEYDEGHERILALDDRPLDIFNSWLATGKIGNDEDTHLAFRSPPPTDADYDPTQNEEYAAPQFGDSQQEYGSIGVGCVVCVASRTLAVSHRHCAA